MKNELRKKYREIRKNSDKSADEIIFNKVISCDEVKNAENIFCYISVNDEVDTQKIIKYLFKAGKTVTVPLCVEKGKMIAVKINSFDDLKEGMYGIPEPKSHTEFEKTKLDLIIVPALAFDKEGYRLGYGGGYYDRFMADLTAFKLGICRSELYVEALPRDEFDIKADKVITERD
ncbi:MAG: 5-formyltetrahydrofolate cyclo-ligase [Clostridia bacterium]|nr:5-formyltetrahydrofolate cyclo-ligase [Clostridia bacterium]